MKTFKQYITEDMPVVTRRQPSGYNPSSYPEPKIIGRVGSYSVTHVPDDMGDAGVFHIHHKNQRIGFIPYGVHSRNTIQMEGPNVMHSHRGKKAKVKNLMPKIYGLVADRMNKKIVSDTLQSEGGKSIWDRLAVFRDVRIRRNSYAADDTPRLSGRYIPAQHEEHVYHKDYGQDFSLVLHPRKKEKTK